jgi:hypothetical protein
MRESQGCLLLPGAEIPRFSRNGLRGGSKPGPGANGAESKRLGYVKTMNILRT